jgi:phosphoglycerate dehydrogenase-like enzyme
MLADLQTAEHQGRREMMPGRDTELGAVATPLTELRERSHIVTAHVPLNSSTRGMFGATQFKLMKKSVHFINTCRGLVHDEAALIAALEAGEITAAGLDVLEQEPTDPANPLLHMNNVVVTPHWADGTSESNERAQQAASNAILSRGTRLRVKGCRSRLQRPGPGRRVGRNSLLRRIATIDRQTRAGYKRRLV